MQNRNVLTLLGDERMGGSMGNWRKVIESYRSPQQTGRFSSTSFIHLLGFPVGFHLYFWGCG